MPRKFTPRRLQRKRSRGWRKPADSVCISRPSTFGNYCFTPGMTQDEAARAYGVWLAMQAPAAFRATVKRLLRGKHLLCWCREGTHCHGDHLLRLANE